MLKLQLQFTQYKKNYENLNLQEKRHSADAKAKRTQMLE